MKLTARHYATQLVCVIEIEDGIFQSLEASSEPQEADVPWIAPGLIDLQINGFGGVDFNRPFSRDDWHLATRSLYAHGCTGFLATLITNSPEGYAALFPQFRALLQEDAANCLGMHLEGPWLNPDPGYRGAHPAEMMSAPNPAQLLDFIGQTENALRLITLAPEMDLAAAEQTIAAGRDCGLLFFLGHSAARGEEIDRAVAAGACGWTHLGNAAPSPSPKFDNVIFHALARMDLFASLIPDGLHLPPYAFAVLARSLGDRLLLTTDAMAAAGTEQPGTYTLGSVSVIVDEEGAARLPETGRLAGSTLTPLQGVFRAAAMAGQPLSWAWDAFSVNPAQVLGFSHGLEPGNSADFCLLDAAGTGRLLETYHRGYLVYQRIIAA